VRFRVILALVSLLGSVLVVVAVPVGPATAQSYAQEYTASCTHGQATIAPNTNLISNPGAEYTTPDAGAPYGEAYPDCWTSASQAAAVGATMSAMPYSQYAAWASTPAVPSNGGSNAFSGGDGVNQDGEYSYAFQTIDLSSLDPGGEPFGLAAFLGGYTTEADAVTVSATFEDASGNDLSEASVGPVTPAMRQDAATLLYQSTTGIVPADATQVLITITGENLHGGLGDTGLADNLDLTIGSGTDTQLLSQFAQNHTAPCTSGQATVALNSNLISNNGAEYTTADSGAPHSEAYPDCWTSASEVSGTGSTLSALPYTAFQSWENVAITGAPAPGSNMFFGGNAVNTKGDISYGFQTIDLSSIDVAGQPFDLSAYEGSYTTEQDDTTVAATFEDAAGETLGQVASVGPVTAAMRQDEGVLLYQATTGIVPAGTTQVVVEIIAENLHGGAADVGMADDLSLVIGPSVDSLLASDGGSSQTVACPAGDLVAPAFNENLISNPGAEDATTYTSSGGTAAPDDEALPDCWTTTSPYNPFGTTNLGATFASIPYGSYSTGIAEPAGGGAITQPPNTGSDMFYGGYNAGATAAGSGTGNDGTASTGSQLIDVSALSPGAQYYELSGYLGGYGSQTDDAIVTATYEDASGDTVGVATIGPVTPSTRNDTTSMVFQSTTGIVPADTAQILVTVTMTMGAGGDSDDGLADDLDLYIGASPADLPPPPAPAGTSTVAYRAPSGTDGNLYNPMGVAATNGTVYIANTKRNVVASVDSGGNTTIVAGSFENYGEFGDGGAATAATLFQPAGLAVDATGDLFIADGGDNVVREITPDGTIRLFAGDGTAGDAGDGGQATSAELDDPQAVAVDASGDVFIADTDSNEVREVTPDGTIHDFAGDGTAGYSGDGGSAADAELGQPSGVAVDADGNVYIADSSNNVIRRVDAADGTISTVAGDYAADQGNNGDGGYSGDGGSATSAQLDDPQGVTLDAAGDLFIADTFNDAIREVTPTGTISTVLNGLAVPTAVTVDNSTATVYIADTGNNRILALTGYASSSPTGPGPGGSSTLPPLLAESPAAVVLPVVAAVAVVGFEVTRRRRRAHRRDAKT
jgi:hypothetical protein